MKKGAEWTCTAAQLVALTSKERGTYVRRDEEPTHAPPAGIAQLAPVFLEPRAFSSHEP
jgi:hypothetical protein